MPFRPKRSDTLESFDLSGLNVNGSLKSGVDTVNQLEVKVNGIQGPVAD